MNKIVNGVANDYEFPNLYDPNISYSKAYTEQLLEEKDKEIERLNNIIDELKRFNRIRENYLQLIADIGYDYDGMNTIDGLKGLIDELCKYALWGRDLYDYEPIYENNGKVYNILDEELRGE